MQCPSCKTWFYFTLVMYSPGDQLTGIHAGWYCNVIANIRCLPKEGDYRVLNYRSLTQSLGDDYSSYEHWAKIEVEIF